MSENDQANQNATSEGMPEAFETHYDEGGSKKSTWCGTSAVCDIFESMTDRVLAKVPLEVTEHLVNSRNELIRAGIALAESSLRKSDEFLERARNAHAQ